jgi:hypothetical protein
MQICKNPMPSYKLQNAVMLMSWNISDYIIWSIYLVSSHFALFHFVENPLIKIYNIFKNKTMQILSFINTVIVVLTYLFVKVSWIYFLKFTFSLIFRK